MREVVKSTQRCGSCKRSIPLEDFSPSYRGKPGTWCRRCFADYNAGRRTAAVAEHQPLTCTQCGKRYVPQQLRTNAKFCSATCKTKAKNAAWAVANEAKKPTLRICKGCGDVIPQSMRSDAKYCTDRCNYRANSAARYARTRGADAEERFTLDEIYRRDEAVCHLCREHCPRAQASMDHLIPVSQGGPHTRANVKLAHHGCNSRKKDRLLSELSWYQPLP